MPITTARRTIRTAPAPPSRRDEIHPETITARMFADLNAEAL